jgi:hypothetical protein
MVDTLLDCSVSSGSYTCSDIAGDNEYFVRYLKNLGDNKVYELKTSVSVKDKDVSDAKVNPATTYIVDSVITSLKETLDGLLTSQDQVNKVIASVRTTLSSTLNDSISKGIIKPNEKLMIVELGEGESFDDYKGSKDLKENEKIADNVSLLISDEKVSNTLAATKNETKTDKYAQMSNEELVKEIFMQTEDDGEMQEWVVNFLASKYDSIGSAETINTFGKFISKLEFSSEAYNDNGEWEPEDWLVNDLQRIGVDENAQQTLITNIIDAMNAKVANKEIFDILKEKINEYYTVKAKDATERSDDENEFLASFPPIVAYLYPENFAKSMTVDTQFQNMGQAIILAIFADSKIAKEVQFNAIKNYLTNNSKPYFEDQLRNLYLVEFEPEFIFEELGFNAGNEFDAIEVAHFEASTQNYWDENGQKEFLTVYTGITKPGWMMDPNDQPDTSKVTSATLTYPKASGGTGTVELEVDTQHSGGEWIGLQYSAWTNCSENTECYPDSTKMDITDHISGDYTITVVYAGQTISKTKNVFVLKNASNLYPELVSPMAYPIWPEELHNVDWSDQNSWSTEQKTAYSEYQEKEEKYREETNGKWYIVMSPNADSNSDGENDVLSDFVVKWNDDALQKSLDTINIPDNIIPAYQVGLNLYEPDLDGDGEVTDSERNACNSDWQKCNTEIFNTWWNNQPIQGTSFKVPVDLPKNSNEGQYNVNIDLIFMDKDTGRHIGQGGHNYAQFRVEEAVTLNTEDTVTFSGKVEKENSDGSALSEQFKVALIQESCTYNPTDYTSDCSTMMVSKAAKLREDGSYILPVTIGQLQTAFKERDNQYDGYFSLIVFKDTNSDGKYQAWNPSLSYQENENAEEAFWPNGGKNMWIDMWGKDDIKIGTDYYDDTTGVYDNKYYTVTSGKDLTVTDMNFLVWSYDDSFYDEPYDMPTYEQLTGNESFTFSGTIKLDEYSKNEGATLPANLKVALVQNRGGWNSNTNESIYESTVIGSATAVTAEGQAYNISVKSSDIMANITNTSTDGWEYWYDFSILVWEDKNGNGQIDNQWDDNADYETNMQNTEMTWWPMNSYMWMNSFNYDGITSIEMGYGSCSENTSTGDYTCNDEFKTVEPDGSYSIEDLNFEIWIDMYNYSDTY